MSTPKGRKSVLSAALVGGGAKAGSGGDAELVSADVGGAQRIEKRAAASLIPRDRLEGIHLQAAAAIPCERSRLSSTSSLVPVALVASACGAPRHKKPVALDDGWRPRRQSRFV